MTPDALQAVQQHLEKAAVELPAVPSFSAGIDQLDQQRIQKELLQQLLGIGTAAIGVGAGARGAVGLYNVARRNLFGNKPKTIGPVAVEVPVPARTKQAATLLEMLQGFLQGNSATTTAEVPWAIPAGMAAGAGGLYAGWKGVDHVLDNRRKQQLDDELATSRDQYNQALLGQYDTPTKKIPQKVAAALDQLYDELTTHHEKSATFGGTAGWLTGGYLGAGGLAAILTAVGVYDAVRKRQPGPLLAAAQKRREQSMQAQRPTQLFAVPEPLPAKPKANPKTQLLQAAGQTFTE